MGYYVKAYKEINAIELQKAALIKIKEKHLIDETKYKILGTYVHEGYRETRDSLPVDIFMVTVCNIRACECGEPSQFTMTFKLGDDLSLTPERVVDYYLYRFSIGSGDRRGRAIRVVKAATETDPAFAYNALLIDMNIRQMSYVMIPSHGPFHRILTARQAYEHKVSVYMYENPDLNKDVDNIDNGTQCDEIR